MKQNQKRKLHFAPTEFVRFIEKNEVLFALSYKPLRSFDPFLYFFCGLLLLMMNWFVKVATTLEVLDCVSLWRRRRCQFLIDRHFEESEIDKKKPTV